MGRLILIEGLPGSGKTTLAKKVAEYLSVKISTVVFEEGAAHPADLAWCSCVPEDRLRSIMQQYPEYKLPMKEHMYMEDGYAIIPYTRFPIEDATFYQLMESYEVYDNRVSFDTFTNLHKRKWQRFGVEACEKEEYIVFECAYLQNHINELLLFHCKEEDEITTYLLELIEAVKELEPVLIYLNQPDVSETLQRVSNVRVDDKGEKVWMERVISYIENSSYGKAHNLQGFKGMVTYFEERKKLELSILPKLPMEYHIINNPDYEWDTVWEEARAIIEGI